MKKIYTIILALIALCGGFYALVRFEGINPDELFPKSPAKAEVHGTASPEKLQQLYDSLENVSFAIRRETDERTLKNLKETHKNLWERILLARNAISKAETPSDPDTIKGVERDIMDTLIKAISITAAVLLTIIIFLIIKITRRAKEVQKVTEKLKSLQSEPAPPPPLGGIDPTMFSTRFRQAPLPQVKPIEMPPQPAKMRKTAKQKVTEAVERMAKALESLRKYTQTLNTADNQGPIASDKLTKTKIRVPSLNNTRISPPADETTYDRRAREKKQILDWARQGRTPSEIAKWLDLPRDQVETVIRLAREMGE